MAEHPPTTTEQITALLKLAAVQLQITTDGVTLVIATPSSPGAYSAIRSINQYAVASRTLVVGDVDAVAQDAYATAITVTLPSDSAVPGILVGHSGEGNVTGAGIVALAPGSGASIPNQTLARRVATGGTWFWRKIAANTYWIGGSLQP